MRPEETVGREEPIREESVISVKQEDRYVPSANELRQRHQINIEFLSSGCVVRIGCKSIAFTNYERALSEINAYVNNPIEAYKKWAKELNVELY